MLAPRSSSSSSKSHHSEHSSSKRKHVTSTAKLDGPAAKMARAIGSDPGREARFLESTDLMKKSGTSHDDKIKKAKSSHRE